MGEGVRRFPHLYELHQPIVVAADLGARGLRVPREVITPAVPDFHCRMQCNAI